MNPARPAPTPPFLRSPHCQLRAHCQACRTDRAWRESVARAGRMPSAEWDCPHGYTAERLPVPEAKALASELVTHNAAIIKPCCGAKSKKT